MNADNLSENDDEDECSVLDVLNLSMDSIEVFYQLIFEENVSAVHAVSRLLDLVSSDIIGPLYPHFKNILQFNTTLYIRSEMGPDIDVIQAATTSFHIFRKIFKTESTFEEVSQTVLVNKMSLERTFEIADRFLALYSTFRCTLSLFRINEYQVDVYNKHAIEGEPSEWRHLYNWEGPQAQSICTEKFHPMLKRRARKEKLRIKVTGISSYLESTGYKFVSIILSPSVCLSRAILNVVGAREGSEENLEGGDKNKELSLATLPADILELLFFFFSFEILSCLRRVCRRFDSLASVILKREFYKIIKKVGDRKESLNDKITSHSRQYINIAEMVERDILAVIELSFACLHHVLEQHMEKNQGCFFPGKILDHGHDLMQRAANHSIDLKDPKIEDFVQNCYEAIYHFKECIEPKFAANDSYMKHARF